VSGFAAQTLVKKKSASSAYRMAAQENGGECRRRRPSVLGGIAMGKSACTEQLRKVFGVADAGKDNTPTPDDNDDPPMPRPQKKMKM